MLKHGIKREEAQKLLARGKSIAAVLRSSMAERKLNS
jgi:hypothetical protein